MSSTIRFYPVDNGDMTLIKLSDSDKTTILIDCNIRQTSEDESSEHFDVIGDLKKHLQRDDQNRLFVDVFLQTHPDIDHLRGITEHFHLGSINQYNKTDEKIIIKEIWSSPIVFRRKAELTDIAQEFSKEAKRRVNLYKKSQAVTDGDRIKVIGEYDENRISGIENILFNEGDSFQDINGKRSTMIKMNVLGPMPKSKDESDDEVLAKNRSSTIIQFEIAGHQDSSLNNLFLSCGDAEVAIWERLWEKYSDNPHSLKYDILLCPHHCSWHSLSHDKEKSVSSPKVSEDAVKALAQINRFGFIISSSKQIKQDQDNPPSYRAQIVYNKITDDVSGRFICTAEHPNTNNPHPIMINLTKYGPQYEGISSQTSTKLAANKASSTVRKHG